MEAVEEDCWLETCPILKPPLELPDKENEETEVRPDDLELVALDVPLEEFFPRENEPKVFAAEELAVVAEAVASGVVELSEEGEVVADVVAVLLEEDESDTTPKALARVFPDRRITIPAKPSPTRSRKRMLQL